MLVCQFHQFAVMFQTLFHQRDGFFQILHVFSPLIVQYQFRSFHFQIKRIGKLTITMHIILQTCEFFFVGGDGTGCLVNRCYCLITVFNHLSDNIQRHLTYMRLILPFFLYKFDQLFAFRSAAFIESRIDGIFVRIDKLAHKHPQQ